VLGTDQFGTWLFCAEGDVHHRADGASVVLPSDGVQLLPASGSVMTCAFGCPVCSGGRAIWIGNASGCLSWHPA
jgi:hypothetical protein